MSGAVHSQGSNFAVGPLSKSDDQGYGMMEVVAWIEKFDFFTEEQSKAHAHLIAVAPEMYEMLEFLVENDSINDSSIDIEIQLLLAKARGEHE